MNPPKKNQQILLLPTEPNHQAPPLRRLSGIDGGAIGIQEAEGDAGDFWARPARRREWWCDTMSRVVSGSLNRWQVI